MLKKLFYLTLFSLILGQLSAVYKAGGLNVYFFDIAVGLFVAYGLAHFLGAEKKFKLPGWMLWFIGFTFIAFITLLINLYTLSAVQGLTAAFYLARWVLYMLSAAVLYNAVQEGLISINDFFKSVLYSGLFLSVAGFIQLTVLPDFTVLDPSYGWDPHKNRLASTLFDPNFTGGYLVLCLSIALGLYYSKNYELSLPEKLFFIIVPGIALFLTFSRSAWGAFALTILLFGLFRSKILLLFAILLAVLTFFAVPRVQTRISGITDPADSAHFRLISWSNTLEIVKDRPIFGVGYNAFRFSQKDYGFFDPGDTGGNSGAGSDSSLLLVLATTGVLGFLFFILGIVTLVMRGVAGRKQERFILLAVLLGMMLHSQFVNSMFYPQILFLWLGLAAVL